MKAVTVLKKEGIHIKKFISFFVTLIILCLINYFVSEYFKVAFIDVSVIIGFSMTIVTYIFTSSGGISSRMVDMEIQGMTNFKLKSDEAKFYPSFILYACVFYTIISIIGTIFVYKQYF
jgi:hypothetical protein